MRDTSGFGPSQYSAVQADRGRFWRDRGFWVQFVIQAGVFFIFGALDLGTAAGLNSEYGTGGWTITQILVISGYVVAFVGLLVQRRRPETGLIIVAVGLLSVGAGLSEVYSLAAGIVCYEAWFISGFLRRRRRAWLVVLVVGAVVGILVASYAPTVVPGWGVASAEIEGQSAASVSKQTAIVAAVLIVLTLISVALCWQLGLGVRRQHERMENLAARAELAAVAERNRIAREMHDIVAHSLTAVIAQADGGRYAGRKEPEKAIEALDTISATGREALAQMRQLLSVLRADEPRDANSAPGVGGVPSLVEDAVRSGLQADLSILGEPRPVSPTVGLTVYRTVQEALTNVLKHAGRVTTHVVLDWRAPGELHIQLDNAPGQGLVDASSEAGGAGGQGLIGLKERARVHGGSATWGPSETFPDGWQVVVMLKA